MEEIVAAVDALLGPIVTSMCTADCSGHGVCTNATCFCNEGGWQGKRGLEGEGVRGKSEGKMGERMDAFLGLNR